MDWLLFIIALPFIIQVILIIMTIVFCVWLIKHPRRGTFTNNEWNSEEYSSSCYNYDDWVTGDGYYGEYEQYL